MKFKCKTKEDEWYGEISKFVEHNSSYEFWIKSRSSIMVIFGPSSRGGFACFPDFKAGCHLTDLKDNFWNTEQLISVLGEVDGLTVSTALFEIADRIRNLAC